MYGMSTWKTQFSQGGRKEFSPLHENPVCCIVELRTGSTAEYITHLKIICLDNFDDEKGYKVKENLSDGIVWKRIVIPR